MEYVKTKEICRITGYSEYAVRAKIKNRVWLEKVHYRKAPDGRLFFSPRAIQRWVEGKGA